MKTAVKNLLPFLYILTQGFFISCSGSGPACYDHLGHYRIGNDVSCARKSNVNDIIDRNYNTWLHYKAAGGDLKEVLRLISLGANLEVKNDKGQTPLHSTAIGGHNNIIETLLRAGAKVNVQDKDGDTPLHWAANKGHLDIVKTLLEKGADMNIQGDYGYTPLHWAAYKGYTEIARAIIEAFKRSNSKKALKDYINIKDNNHNSALAIAKEQNHATIITYLESELKAAQD